MGSEIPFGRICTKETIGNVSGDFYELCGCKVWVRGIIGCEWDCAGANKEVWLCISRENVSDWKIGVTVQNCTTLQIMALQAA